MNASWSIPVRGESIKGNAHRVRYREVSRIGRCISVCTNFCH